MKEELSDQTRAIIAAGLALVVIIGWSLLYKPPQPAPEPQPTSTQFAPSAIASGLASVAPKAPTNTGPTTTAQVAATAEKTIVVESDLYHVELSNRGAVVRSWQLRKYLDEHNPPRTLDLVNTDASRDLGEWPFSLTLDKPDLESEANSALFEVTSNVPSESTIHAPAEITFTWSDGHLEVTKRLKFDSSYIVNVQTSVQLDGQPLAHGLSWRGGFGDPTAISRRGSLPVQVFFNFAGSINTLAVAKLGQPKQPDARIMQPGPYEFVGIEDTYFTAAFLPPLTPVGQAAPPGLTLTDLASEHDTQGSDGKIQKTPIANMAAGAPGTGPLDLRVYVGPKSIDGLKAVQPPLNKLVDLGWFAIIAEPMFYVLLWIHKYVPNYGWAIVLFACALNMALFPLKTKGMRAAQKMQRVQPEIKAIQEKYKKYSMRDPRKAEMNKEVMAVYSRESINPLGGCWPQLIQLPIWIAAYKIFYYTIELRQAPWMGWIHDLSAPDPYYILPVLLALTGYLTTKMTPTPGVDPAQARMMSVMPLFFGFIFIFYPSGVALYIFSGYAIGIAQQWYLNRTSPLKPPGKKKK